MKVKLFSRLWSDYNYFGKFQKSAEIFHEKVEIGIEWLQKCWKFANSRQQRRHCIYDPIDELGEYYGDDNFNPAV